MELNKETIKHFRSEMIPLEKLKQLVLLNEAYLKEKPTWYYLQDKVQYFKVRNDFRIFAELFFNQFAKKVMDLESLDYDIACIRTIPPTKEKEYTKYGLLAENFQNFSYNHYLASELMMPEISPFIYYENDYSLQSFLNFFKIYLSQEDYEINKQFLIKLFIADGFTYQLDRNPNNIAFQIPKIAGVNYKNRLRIEQIKSLPNKNEYLIKENGLYKLKGFAPNCVYDSERSIGMDHKNVSVYNKEECWYPNFPFNSELLFANGEIARKISDKKYDGLDPNLVEIYLEYPDLCRPYFEKLAYDDEYRIILENFMSKPSPVVLSNEEYEYVNMVLKDRQETFKRILKI